MKSPNIGIKDKTSPIAGFIKYDESNLFFDISDSDTRKRIPQTNGPPKIAATQIGARIGIIKISPNRP